MVHAPVQTLSLDAFLQLPETKPSSEFINGQIVQKLMPQGEHSTLQGELISTINAIAKTARTACTFPELRCTFGGVSIVPDVSVFRWHRIPRSSSGRIANRFELYPDWAIEILSPNQSQTKVLENLLHCSQQGTDLGWLLNPEDESVLVVFSESRVKVYRVAEPLPVLEEIRLTVSATDIFSWLTLPT